MSTLRSRKTWAGAVLALVVWAYAGGAAVATGGPADADDVDMGPLPAAWSTSDVDGDGIPLIGTIVDVDQDAEGCTYLLDFQQKHVIRLDPQGRFLNMIGRPGEGPGELTNPTSLSCVPEGVMVTDGAPTKLVTFNRGGVFIESRRAGSDGRGDADFVTVQRIAAAGERYLALGSRVNMTEGMEVVSFLSVLDSQASFAASLIEATTTLADMRTAAGMKRLQPLFEALWCAGSNIAVVPDPCEYRVDLYDWQGKLLCRHERPYEKRSYTAEERERMLQEMRENQQGLAGLIEGIEELVPRYKPTIRAVAERQGELWVMPSASDDPATGPDASACIFDVFSLDCSAGEALNRRVIARLDGYEGGRDTLFLLRHGILVIKQDDEGTRLRFHAI